MLFCEAYLRDVTPVGYGGPEGKYGIVLPVSNPSGPVMLKDRRATCRGEIQLGTQHHGPSRVTHHTHQKTAVFCIQLRTSMRRKDQSAECEGRVSLE